MTERIALITGAASGIGLATARRLADEGVSGLVLMDRAADALEAASAELARDGLSVLELAQDVADPDAWRESEGVVRERFGRLDHVVANAGVADGVAIEEMSFDRWRRVLSVNLDGVFLTLQAGMRLMRDGGTAVVVASAAAVKAEVGTAAYAASKAGAAHLARVAAKEGAARGIRVNTVAPGGVETPIWRDVPFFEDMVAKTGGERQAFDAMAAFATPLKRFATAEEVAGLIAFLLSEGSGTVTGAMLLSDGGYSL